jgi:hypothetical protein
MADTLALNDNQRTLIGIAFTIVVTLNVSLAGLAAANQMAVPTYVYFALAIAAVLIQAIKDKLGVETATTARVARETAPTLEQNRKIPPQEKPTV